jgi:hypothetical protein
MTVLRGRDMAQGPDGKELEQLERFRRSIARAGPPLARTGQDSRPDSRPEAWAQRNVTSALEQVRQAAELARLTEQQNREMEARGQELVHRVAEELELAMERVRSAEARAQAAEIRAAHAEARVAEIQQWLDSVHDLIVEEFAPSLTYDERSEQAGRAELLPRRSQSS